MDDTQDDDYEYVEDKQPEDVSPHFDANLDTYLQRLRGDVCSTILMQN